MIALERASKIASQLLPLRNTRFIESSFAYLASLCDFEQNGDFVRDPNLVFQTLLSCKLLLGDL